jgi:protein translocase SecG subunit
MRRYYTECGGQSQKPPFHGVFAFFALRGIIFRDMETVRTVLPYVQIVLSLLLVTAILLQQRGSSMGGAFGGDNFSATYHKRRGAELFLFKTSVFLGIVFVASAFLSLVI